MSNLNARLHRLEQRHDETRWCQCDYDLEKHRVEDLQAMDSGVPTPSRCDVCGGARISIQYVPMEQVMQLRPWSER